MREEPQSGAKPFQIPKRLVWEAYKQVKANQGAAGVDAESIEAFERHRNGNLYRLWNRMSSGTYFPPPVREVTIPKRDGGERKLGIPTVTDRIAQTVVKLYLEPLVEPHFDPDSYGYRPGKSAIQAVGKARERCWHYHWVLDLDLQAFFDSLDHDLLLRAVGKYTDCRWVLLYLERWLRAPVQHEDGTLAERNSGTPQGGVVSPLLANIFLHHAFDRWMRQKLPGVPFERYADDIVIHCRAKAHAERVRRAVQERLQQCRLAIHVEKTKIVYCKDTKRRHRYPDIAFDFLGFTFRPRLVRNREGTLFVTFSPAVSRRAAREMRQELRRWRIPRRSDKALSDLANMLNPTLRGWIGYYGSYRKSELGSVFHRLNFALVRWARAKYRLGSHRQAARWLKGVARREPSVFAHWHLLGIIPTVA